MFSSLQVNTSSTAKAVPLPPLGKARRRTLYPNRRILGQMCVDFLPPYFHTAKGIRAQEKQKTQGKPCVFLFFVLHKRRRAPCPRTAVQDVFRFRIAKSSVFSRRRKTPSERNAFRDARCGGSAVQAYFHTSRRASAARYDTHLVPEPPYFRTDVRGFSAAVFPYGKENPRAIKTKTQGKPCVFCFSFCPKYDGSNISC